MNKALIELWDLLPTLRLGQLVDCLYARARRLSGRPNCDMFFMEDKYMLEAIKEWIMEIHDSE